MMLDPTDDGLSLTPEERWEELGALQEAYPTFDLFLYDVMTGLMGFDCTWLQLDIADYLEHGPLYRMIQAQRGQAKTTITAAYGVWRLIHNPSCRVLVISAGDTQATEIANWVLQIIRNMPELRCMRPDTQHGDRDSVKAFDVHYILKGPEKSPSVACIGISANSQGKRADVLIADDIESAKNSQTAVQRERIAHLSKDFSSICSTGDIIYLGTPQSVESIYNGLPARGFDVRVWPGRFPTADEEANYGPHLAPSILAKMQANPKLRQGGGLIGDRGQPTDPVMLSEEKLQKKERDQGMAYFQLQHMLDTRLADKDRFPLKPENIIWMSINPSRNPIEVNFLKSKEYQIEVPIDFPIKTAMYRAASFGTEFGSFDDKTYMYIDPSGGGANGDELAYAVTRFMANKVFVLAVGGMPGGYGQDVVNKIVDLAIQYKVNLIGIERNYGNGAFRAIMEPVLIKKHGNCGIEEMWETGQKELRIIDILEPVLSSNRLVMDLGIIRADQMAVQQYPIEKRSVYSLFFQLGRITRDRNALVHDDRVDALAGAVRFWVDLLARNEEDAVRQAAQRAYEKLMADPLGYGPAASAQFNSWRLPTNSAMSSLDRRKKL